MQLPTQLPTRLPTRLNTIEDYYLATGGGGRGKFALDQIREPSAAAFSVFLLTRRAADLPIMQVRRDTDNDEVQVLADLSLAEPRISLDSPLVGSASTFGDFLGSASGFVFSWFDQSGNARHASQATTGSQPRIANAGVLDTNSNGRVAVSFVGTGVRLALTNAGGLYRNLAQARTFFVGERPTAVGTQVGFLASTSAATTAARCSIAVLGGNYIAGGRRLDTDGVASSTQPHSEGLKLIINRSRWSDGNVQLRINGSNQTAANYSSGAGNSADTDSLLVEMGQAGSSNWAGTISETIVYRSALAGTESILEQNIAARYGITIA
jgi:hypothetical protein